VKYFAAEQRIKVEVRSYPIEIALMFGIFHFVRPESDFGIHFGPDAWSQFEHTVNSLASDDPESDPFREAQYFVDDLYFKMVEFRKRSDIPALFVSISLCGAAVTAIVTPSIKAKDDAIEKLRRNFATMKARIDNMGGSLVADRRSLRVVPVDGLSKKVLRTENLARRADLARKHASELAISWTRGDRETASLHANLAHSYNPQLDPKSSNNLGYVMMAIDADQSSAEKMFRCAIEGAAEDSQTRILSTYNLAILLAKQGRYSAAVQLLTERVGSLENIPLEERKVACLHEPTIQDGKLSFHEVSQPDLQVAYNRTIEVLIQVIGHSSPTTRPAV
jgi:hypothetical protein